MSRASEPEMAAKQEVFDRSVFSEEESSTAKFQRKFKESPFMVIGLVGCVGVVAYGFHSFKNRNLKPSIFLMQLRVAAQGAVVGMLTLGCSYQLYNRLTGKSSESSESSKGR